MVSIIPVTYDIDEICLSKEVIKNEDVPIADLVNYTICILPLALNDNSEENNRIHKYTIICVYNTGKIISCLGLSTCCFLIIQTMCPCTPLHHVFF